MPRLANIHPVPGSIIDPAPPDTAEARVLKTLGLLTRGALHEISNPLVGLIGSSELALREVEPGTKLYDRIALTHRTGLEVAAIVRALQAFVRSHSEPAGRLSLGDEAAAAVTLVGLVQPVHDVTLSSSGDATVVAAPGEVRSSLVELLVAGLGRAGSGGEVELVVRTDGGDAVVTATGGAELRLPLAEELA